jgi:hypothetical protein
MDNNYQQERNKFFVKDYKSLQKLEKKLFDILINITNDSLKKKKYIKLAKYDKIFNLNDRYFYDSSTNRILPLDIVTKKKVDF